MTGGNDGSTTDRCLFDHLRHEDACDLIEAGMRLIEQPQLRSSGHQQSEAHTATLPCREASKCGRSRTARQPDTLKGGQGSIRVNPSGPQGEVEVLDRRQLVVQARFMTEEAHPTAHLARGGDQVCAQHLGLAGGHRNQPSKQSEQTGLARAIGTKDDHDLTHVEVEVDP